MPGIGSKVPSGHVRSCWRIDISVQHDQRVDFMTFSFSDVDWIRLSSSQFTIIIIIIIIVDGTRSTHKHNKANVKKEKIN